MKDAHSENRLADAAVVRMCEAAIAALPKETGGILLGYRTNQDVIVTGAIEVHDRRATRTSYRRSHRKAAKCLAEALADEPSDSAVGYVGEWHSHPAPQPPSRQDLASLAATALAAPDDVVLAVLSRDGDTWRIVLSEAQSVVRHAGPADRSTRRGDGDPHAKDPETQPSPQ